MTIYIFEEKGSENASLEIKTIEINSVQKCKIRLNTAEEMITEKSRKDPDGCRERGKKNRKCKNRQK